MRICVMGGAGYVGLITGIGLAEAGNHVTNVDVDLSRILQLQSGELPIHEPGLDQALKRNLDSGRLTFDTEAAQAVKSSQLVFITVGTPPGPDGRADLSDIIKVTQDLALWLDVYKVLAIRSTVPTGSLEIIRSLLSQRRQEGRDYDIVVNPEFLREGKGLRDFLAPDRIVIGAASKRAKRMMREVYEPIIQGRVPLPEDEGQTGNSGLGSNPVPGLVPVVETDVVSAQMIKYASNAFLAARVSFINEVAGLCENVGAGVTEVVRGIGYDPRIGHGYLEAGLGFGGPCIEKDLRALIGFAGDSGHDPLMLRAVLERNEKQVEEVVTKLERIIGDSLAGKTIAALGLTFKAGTNDARNSLAVKVVNLLTQKGACLRVYDPEVTRGDTELKPNVAWCANAYEAAENADALVILTEWPSFSELDYEKIRAKMASARIVDSRNLLDPAGLRANGFTYVGVGR